MCSQSFSSRARSSSLSVVPYSSLETSGFEVISQDTSRLLSSSKTPLVVGAVLETEPVRRLPRSGKAPSCILAAAGMLAPMVLNARARDGLHYNGEADQFFAQNTLSDRSCAGCRSTSRLDGRVYVPVHPIELQLAIQVEIEQLFCCFFSILALHIAAQLSQQLCHSSLLLGRCSPEFHKQVHWTLLLRLSRLEWQDKTRQICQASL